MPVPGAKTSVAVVIPAYQRASTLERAVASCQRQTRRVDEIVVVDDGSTDDTPAVVARLAENDARVRYLRLPANRGAQAARVAGIVATRCDWVALLDSDDELTEDSIQARLDAASRSGLEPGIVFGDLVDARGGARKTLRFERMSGYAFPRMCRTFFSPWCGTQMVRKRCFEATGYPSTDVPALHGVDMAMTIARIFPVAHCGKPVVVWHESTGQITSDKSRFVRAYRMLVDKYAGDIRRHLGPAGIFFWKARVLQHRINFEYNRADVPRAAWKKRALRVANALLARLTGAYLR